MLAELTPIVRGCLHKGFALKRRLSFLGITFSLVQDSDGCQLNEVGGAGRHDVPCIEVGRIVSTLYLLSHDERLHRWAKPRDHQ